MFKVNDIKCLILFKLCKLFLRPQPYTLNLEP